MSGIDLKAIGRKLDRYVITKIRPDSPAARSDIQIGDEVYAINGHLAEGLTLGKLNNFFRLKEGRKLRIELLREEEKLVRKIRLERVI